MYTEVAYDNIAYDNIASIYGFFIKISILKTRHENFHGKFSLCAECVSRSIGQNLKCRLKVFTDYLEGHIWGKQSDLFCT